LIVRSAARWKRFRRVFSSYGSNVAASGEYSVWVLAARVWETFIGGALGVASAILLLPLHKKYFGE
jgi:hypothetical protein